jgi:hypothetical protein
MLRKPNLVRASLASCALSLVLSSTSWAAPLTVNVHIQAPVVRPPVMTKVLPTGLRDPKHFESHPSSGNNPKGDDGGIGGHANDDARRWGQKSPGGGQPGEPWNR